MIKRIKVLVPLMAILLMTSLQLSGQRKNWHNYNYVPTAVTMDEVVSNFRQYVEEIPYFNEAAIQYGAQNEAYNVERGRKTPKAVYLQ